MLPVHQRGNLVGEASYIHSLLKVTLLPSPCQSSVCPRTPGTVSTIRVLTTTQLLYNIASPHCEDSHSFFHLCLWIDNCHSHQEAFFQPPDSHLWPQYSMCTNGADLLWSLFYTCTDITALWGSHFRHHCHSGWLRRQAKSNPGPLVWQAHTLPVHQRGNLGGEASTYTACSKSLWYSRPMSKLKWKSGFDMLLSRPVQMYYKYAVYNNNSNKLACVYNKNDVNMHSSGKVDVTS